MREIVIVGGGLIGSICACGLLSKGFNVCIIDSASSPALQASSDDGRAFALAPTSVNVLKNLGIWEKLNGHFQPIELIHTSDPSHHNWIRFDSNHLKEPLGYMVESHKLRQVLAEHMMKQHGIERIYSAKIQSVQARESCIDIILNNNHVISAALLVATDGRNSFIRELTDVPVLKWPYQQKAIVCNVMHTRPHFNTAFEHFLPTGPLALLPLQGNRSGLVWSNLAGRADDLMNLSDAEFCQELTKNFNQILGEFSLETPRRVFPLEVVLTTNCIQFRIVFAGDAAHVLHPVAGQGLNVGIRDVAALVDCLFDAKSLGLDIGSLTALEPYQRGRRFEHLAMTLFTDGMVKMFSCRSFPIKLLRKMGMGLLQNMPPLKSLFSESAMGHRGQLPSLAQWL